MGKLTAKRVESLTEPGRYSDDDGSGFHLRIDPQGRKYFVLRVHVGGKRKDINIGSAKRMTLSAAREKARMKRAAIEDMGDAPADVPTFARAAELAHAARTSGFKNGKHVAQWLTTLQTYANPAIGEKPVDQVTRADVVKILEPIWTTKAETAGRVLQRIDRVLRWAVGLNYREDRIDMALVRDALPARKRKRKDIRRMPAVPWREAPTFWQEELPLSRSEPEVRLGLAALILTAARPGNIATVERHEVDLDERVWIVPAEKMKMEMEHHVPLSDEAVRVFRQAMSLHERRYIFSISDQPISPDTLRMAMRRMDRTETPHGFRSTFKDWSLANGWADNLSEWALAHLDDNSTRAAYARDPMVEERRPMMAAWAAYLAGTPRSAEAPQPE